MCSNLAHERTQLCPRLERIALASFIASCILGLYTQICREMSDVKRWVKLAGERGGAAAMQAEVEVVAIHPTVTCLVSASLGCETDRGPPVTDYMRIEG